MVYAIQYCNESHIEYWSNGIQFGHTCSVEKGPKKFGKKDYNATLIQITQPCRNAAFEPAHVNTFSQIERKRVIESLIFLVENRIVQLKVELSLMVAQKEVTY